MVMAKLRPTYAFVKRLEFLSSGRIHLRDSVKVVTLFYNTHGSNSSGVRQFVKEQLPPIQFKNPDVQFVLLKNRKPSPFVDIYLADGRCVTLDVENKPSEHILSELKSVAAIPDGQVQQAERQKTVVNSADFGDAHRGRLCICQVPGQTPCPSVVPIRDVEHSWHNKNNSDS